jgi:hypothetical protein
MNWRGWYAIGSILMMIVGAFKFITGIIGLFRDQWIVLGYNGYMLVDITGLAVWWLIIGALLVLAGMAAMVAKTWGRIVGIVALSLAAVSERDQEWGAWRPASRSVSAKGRCLGWRPPALA